MGEMSDMQGTLIRNAGYAAQNYRTLQELEADKVVTLTTAQHYLLGRPPYPPQLIELVRSVCRLKRGTRMLDVGSGPAQLAIAYAPHFEETVALDQEHGMLIEAQRAAREANVRLTCKIGSAPDEFKNLGKFEFVTMGRAFCWLDREEALRQFDSLLVNDAHIAIFNEAHPDVPENTWLSAYRKVIRGFAKDEPMNQRRNGTGRESDEDVLLASRFNKITKLAVIEKRTISLSSIVSRALSTSVTSVEQIGALTKDLKNQIVAEVGPYCSSESTVTEVIEMNAIVATRPATNNKDHRIGIF